MADSDEERGSDVDPEEDGEPGFDPTADLENMTEKERKKWEKSIQKWKLFMNFLFRHVAIASYRYNTFESNDLTQFMISLEKAENLREHTKLKKGEEPRISSYKVMKEASDLLLKQNHVNEAKKIKAFLDIAGRLRGIGMIAGGFYKALKKGKVKGLDKIKYYLDYWKGFCVRSFDYNELQYRNADPEAFNALEKKFLIWPTTLRTCIHMSNKFLKRCSESTGIDLMDPDQKQLQKHMQPAEFVVATKIEELLNKRVTQETRTFALLGKEGKPESNPGVLKGQRGDKGNPMGNQTQQNSKWELPDLEDIDPEMLKPIDESNGNLLVLPADPPKEKKKKGKKGKKGKGRGKSAGSKGKKKKKK